MCLLVIQRFILLFEFETFTVSFVTLPVKFHDFILCPSSLHSLLYPTYYCTTFTTFFEAITVRNVDVNYMIIVNTLLWIISMLYHLGLLTSKATKVANEVEKTENLVHTLLNCTIDRQTKVELEQFSLQLLHRKIKFTVNQYFTLDNTLFQSVSKEYFIDLISTRIYGDLGSRCLPLQLHAMIIVKITSFRKSDTVTRR